MLRRSLLNLTLLIALAACAPQMIASADVATNDVALAADHPDSSDVMVAPAPVTWYQDIAPLIIEKCGNCHVEDGVGPFPLRTLAQFRALLSAVVPAVQSRRMPPWKPLAGCQHFRDDRSLTDAQIAMIVAWSEAGAPEGDAAHPAALPTARTNTFRADMRLRLHGPYQPVFSNAAMADDYHCFALDYDSSQTRWVTGYDVEPGVRPMVHHANLHVVPAADARRLDPSGAGYSCFGGVGASAATMVGVWVPGSPPALYPDNTGIEIPAGSALIVQYHYYRYRHDAAAPPTDQSTVILQLAPSRPARLGSLVGPSAADPIVIPPRALSTRFPGTWTPTSNGVLWGVLPHMHMAGRRIRVDVGDACMADISSWDFHWQQIFMFAQPGGIPIQRGVTTRVLCEYMNLSDREIHGGEGSDQEMCGAPFYFTPEP